jgi:GT2 family glycosyltransferase
MIPVMVVPVLTRYELLYRMLESIDHPVETLVVVDNGNQSSRNTLAAINTEHIAHRHVLKMPSNLGVPASWNLGIKATPFAPWWMVANFDVTWPAGALAAFGYQSGPNTVAVSGEPAQWCVFTIGENVVQRVGLFDEGIHPAYWEDIDYMRRCAAHSVPITRTGILVNHANSSTLATPYGAHNARTFGPNQQRAQDRAYQGDLTNGEWSLATRRALSWD